MSKPTTSQYGQSPKSFGPADRLVYAIIPQALSSRAQLYTSGRYSNDGKLALVCALDADPNRPMPPENGNSPWRWMSVDETRHIVQTDPNWVTTEEE